MSQARQGKVGGRQISKVGVGAGLLVGVRGVPGPEGTAAPRVASAGVSLAAEVPSLRSSLFNSARTRSTTQICSQISESKAEVQCS